MTRLYLRALILFVVLFAAGSAFGGPSLDIRSGPVINNGYTGPSYDPGASQGMWFLDSASGQTDFRTHEFYDDPTGSDGSQGNLAISGIVMNLDLYG